MKKFLTAFVALVAGLAVGGCGTLTVGGTPILGFESDKDKEGRPVPAFGTVITVYQYGATTQPAPTPPGAPPPSPVLQPPGTAVTPPAVQYSTVYKKVDDPTLRAFVNQSSNVVRLRLNDQKEEIRLEPYQSSVDIAFKPGEHRVKVTIERPTASFGVLEVYRFILFTVRPEDRWQAIYVGW